MSLDSVIGQPFALDLCRQWLKRQTTHPLLMVGPEGVGKKMLALEVAKALNCASGHRSAGASEKKTAPTPRRSDAPTLDSCDACVSCRKISAGNHPDVRVIDLAWQAMERKEPIEKQQSLRIETILTERHRLLQSPGEGVWKVSIVDDTHRLTPDAANVLLKILEEPPANTAIFLVTPFKDRLLTTIVSRCQPVRFRYLDQTPRLSHEQIEEHRQADALWESLGKQTGSRLLHASGGRSKSFKPTKAEMEQQIRTLLVPAARALRAGDIPARGSVQKIQNALAQLRQNVQPTLVYDNLLLQLAKSAGRRPTQDHS